MITGSPPDLRNGKWVGMDWVKFGWVRLGLDESERDWLGCTFQENSPSHQTICKSANVSPLMRRERNKDKFNFAEDSVSRKSAKAN